MTASQRAEISELDAASFLPYLVNKVPPACRAHAQIGDKIESVRKDTHTLLRSFCKCYASSKLFNYVMEVPQDVSVPCMSCLPCGLVTVVAIWTHHAASDRQGLKSKNAKQRAECLIEMESLIGAQGMAVCQVRLHAHVFN